MSDTAKPLAAVLACLLLVAAVASASAIDDASDVRVGPRALAVAGEGALRIDRPGDRDWYVEPGREVGAFGTASVTVAIEGGTGCTSAEPLRITLHNPEGSYMRTFRFAADTTGEIRIPELPGNYFLKVYATDAECSGLTYRLGHVAKGDPALAGETPCDTKARRRTEAQKLLDTLRERRQRVRGAARRRYDAYVNTARSQLATARRADRACGAATAPPPPSASNGGGGGGGSG